MAGGSIPPVGTERPAVVPKALALTRVGTLPTNALLGIEQRLLGRLRRLRLDAGQRVIVGFSGGPDSLALAVGLARVASRAGVVPVLGHVDHAARPESGADRAAALALASQLGLAFEQRVLAQPACELHPGVGPEEAMRRERFLGLASTARGHRTDVVALAHHAEDQAETVLLHLGRGAGLRGAGGMRELAPLTLPWWASDEPVRSLRVWRPFLEERRTDLAAYVGQARLEPRVDPSNDDPAYRRNAVRHQLLPLLEQVMPGSTAALARYAALAAEDEAIIGDLCGDWLARARGGDGTLTLVGLRSAPGILRGRIVRAWVEETCGPPSISRERTEALLLLAEAGGNGGVVELGNGRAVRRTRTVLLAQAGSDEERGGATR